MANWNPPKVNPFAGLAGQKAPKAEPAPRRVSMRAMKAVDLKKLSADDVLEVDEFSIAPEDAADAAGAEDFEREAEHPREKAQKQQQQAKPQGPHGRDAKPALPSLKPEAFGPPQNAKQAAAAPAGTRRPMSLMGMRAVTKLPPRAVDPKFSALVALDAAKDPGVLFVDDSAREGHREEDEDPELRSAVEECIRLLFGVSGIHHVGPGKNEKGEPVIVVAAGEGFTHDSMKAVPEKVHRFATLVALPFDLVPLRRSR